MLVPRSARAALLWIALFPLALPALALLGSCATQGVAARVATAHGADWYGRPPVHADLTVEFGGNRVLAGRMIYDAGTNRSRLELADGTVAVFDGERAWVGGGGRGLKSARFHLLTWSYFLSAPWKIGDPGTRLEPLGTADVEGVLCDVSLLTFDDGVGDTPDDWYRVYVDPRTDLLRALAYIVTYGTPLEEAELEPHAAIYADYARVDGLRVPSRLVFRLWGEEQGFYGDPIGEVLFSGVRFGAPPDGAFDVPPGATQDALPE